MRGTLLFGAAVVMSALEVQAQNITTPDPEGCVDPTGFSSCLTNVNTTAIQCASQPNASVTACEVQALVDEMLCYYGSCWNKVSHRTLLAKRSRCRIDKFALGIYLRLSIYHVRVPPRNRSRSHPKRSFLSCTCRCA